MQVRNVGKVSLYYEEWHKFTSDPWILQTVTGYKIEFESLPL